MTFAEIDPTSLTARAGIVRGDRLLYETLPLRGRRFAILNEEVPGGAPIAFAIVHDGKTRWVTVRATDLLAIGQTESLTYAIAGLAMGIVGLLLVLLRPSRMTWAFALIAPALLLPFDWIFWAQQSEGTAATLFDVFVALIYAMQPAAIMIFASRFPNDRPTGVARLVDRLGAARRSRHRRPISLCIPRGALFARPANPSVLALRSLRRHSGARRTARARIHVRHHSRCGAQPARARHRKLRAAHSRRRAPAARRRAYDQ